MKTDIDYADVQDLFESNLDAFFAILNQKLIKFNQWEEIEEFVNEQLENVPDMSDEDVAMSGHAAAADALGSNVHDNGEPVMGANSPTNWKSIGGQSLNNINGEPGAFAPPKSGLKKFGADG